MALEATDGLRWFVGVDGDDVTSRRATEEDTARAVIASSGRDLLALLLGCPPRQPLRFGGDDAFARSFARSFPGP